jgi:cytochrome P450
MTEQRLPVFDFTSVLAMDDPYPVYAELRAAGPLAKGAMPATWVVTRHGEVSALLRDDRLGHQFPREYLDVAFGPGATSDFQANVLLNRDPPDHTRLRALMGRAFRGLTVRKLHDHIADVFDALLEPALDRGTFDVVADLAFPLPIQVICELLGIEDVDREDVRARVADLVAFDDDRARALERADRGTAWLRAYIGDVLSARTPDPDGDLLQRMLAAEHGDDAFSHSEIVDNAILLFFAGFETTSNLIANGCAALLEHPGEWWRLAEVPTRAASAVEEFLRYDSPVPFVNRLTLEPVEIGSRVVKEGRWLMLLLASANRDGDAFRDPDTLDIGRTPNPHVAFAGGIHHCLGAMLARVEGEVVFSRLAQRCATFDPAAPAERRRSAIRSFASVPVSVEAA